MADSDDEFERKKGGRDKFRRERNDYERRSDDRRRDSWDDRRPSNRGGQRGWRGNLGGAVRRDMWSGRGNNNMRDRREMYPRPYEDRRRERYSPGRYDSGAHPAKRMRRDWDEAGYPGMYDSPFQVSSGPPGADRSGWNPRGMEVSNGPPEVVGFRERRDSGDPDFPTQPPMMTFKQFLNKQDDTISQDDAIKLFDAYKLDFKRQQINEFFLAHKDEECGEKDGCGLPTLNLVLGYTAHNAVCRFKAKYHPDERDKQQTAVKMALETRRRVYEALKEKKFFEGVSVDLECTDALTKILDATVILLEGGHDLDLTILDKPLDEPVERTVQSSESMVVSGNEEKKDTSEKHAEEEKISKETKDSPLEMTISPEQEELKRKAMEYQKQQEAAAEEAKAQRRNKKSLRKKSDYSYESDSDTGSDSDSDTEPAPPGLEVDLDRPDTESVKPENDSPIAEVEEKTSLEKDNTADQNKEKNNETELRPRPLHQTNSIFLRNLATNITKQEVESLCRKFPGFMRVALQDPQPERRFSRRGWVTFSKDCNIKEVCWSLNNIRLRDCELGATLNRELKVRIRAVSGITLHKQVMRNDIKIAARIIQTLDKKQSLWEETEQEKRDSEKEPQFGFVSKNPVLKNITDFLVEEGSFEEDELIGEMIEEKKDVNPEVTVEKDESLIRALDRMVLYLRLVHSIDYYSANEYPNEDEMPHRCGIMHARGSPPSSKIAQNDVNDWINNFEKKIKPFMEATRQIADTEAIQLGKKDPDAEVEKFVQSNTQELSKDKWLCPLSGKKFKGPDFVRKHIFNKQQEKIEEVKQEVKFFNNYLLDPKRPSLPEHPSSKPKPPPAPSPQPQQTPPVGQRIDPYGTYIPPGGLGTFGAVRPPAYGSVGSNVYPPNPFSVRETRPLPDTLRRNNFGGVIRLNRRSDPRQLIQYTDLDAPDDGDIF